MYHFTVKNFNEWRAQAKQMLAANVLPRDIIWQAKDDTQVPLFADAIPVPITNQTFTIPKAFLELALRVSAHNNLERWSLLYQALWRITHGEKYLLNISSDLLVRQLMLMQKAVSRDIHKMKAFVRFRRYSENAEEFFIAWYKPNHAIIHFVAPFFKKRFAVMRWTIMTPDETVSWDGQQFIFSEGVKQNPQLDDEIETLWCTYYKSIFNPARVKIKAMKNEMPVRYWQTMPETKLIAQLIQEAPARAAKMINEKEGFQESAKEFFRPEMNLSQLKKAAASCRACSLYTCARQTVFGKGPQQTELMIVGEQPGLQEDIKGEPFVGPAGQLLRETLEELRIDIEQIYMTNIVKHFKHTVVGNRQIHRSPDVREVNACKPWVMQEMQLINPKVVICLGNTAAKGLIKPGFAMNTHHGIWYHEHGREIIGTFHPSALLRVPDEERKQVMYNSFKADLSKALQQSKA